MPTRVKSPVCGCQEEWFINQPEGSHFMLSFNVMPHCGRVISFAFQGPIYFSLHFPFFPSLFSQVFIKGVAVALHLLKRMAMTILLYLDDKGACVPPVSHSNGHCFYLGHVGQLDLIADLHSCQVPCQSITFLDFTVHHV